MHESSPILVIAPDDESMETVRAALESDESPLIRARTPTEAVKFLEDRVIDAVICPVKLTGLSAASFVRIVDDTDPTVPVVLIGDGDQSARERALEAGAAAYVRDVEAALRDEVRAVRTRTRIRTELRQHRRLGRVVRDLSESLFGASSVEAIERFVYQQLMETDLYQFVWIGQRGPERGFELHVPVRSRTAVDSLPGLSTEEGRTAFDRALEARTVELVEGMGTFTRKATMRGNTDNRAGTRHGGLTTAIVPFTAEGSTLGVAVLATDRPTGIDGAERSVLETLAALVGMAIWLVEAREELQQVKRRVEEFAGVIAHEIRNPLAIAMTQLELVREGEDGRAIDRIESSLDRIDRHVGNLVTLATGLNVESVTDEALAETASAAWEELETPSAELIIDSSMAVRADHELLIQMFANLFRNAIEQGGEGTTIRVGTFENGFYVADDGPGIPPVDRDDVFEWGYSGTAGLGIGLTVVREICRVHGWTIRVTESRTGGARFEILLGENDGTAPEPGDRLAELFGREADG